MGKYSDLVKDFDYHAKYKDPVVDPLIVGYTGLDPDEKVKEEEIDHEGLSGLLGGGITGHYHITDEQLSALRSFQGQIDDLASKLQYASSSLSEALQDLSQSVGTKIQELENGQADFDEELSKAISDFESTSEVLSARLDSIIGQTTEDAEILDARVDANGDTHVNLGNNIRYIHRALLDYINYESEFREHRDDELQEQINEISGTVISEMKRFQDALLKYKKVLKEVIEDRREKDANIYSAIDLLGEALTNVMVMMINTINNN